MATATINQLAIYPVKSLRGYSIQSTLLTPQGLQYDRQWMIINAKNQFVTQRKLPTMVLVHTHIDNGVLTLSTPQQQHLPPLNINIDTPSHHDSTSAPIHATIWKDSCAVLDEGPKASEWLSQALHTDQTLRLVRMANHPRPQSKPELLGEQTHTLFADAAPFLITNTASLDALNTQLHKHSIDPVTMERFRPNIVLTGLHAFAEHQIRGFTHSHYSINHCYPCQRCIMPTIDVDTGIRHPQQQPFSLLADINAMPNNPKAPAFGENGILDRGDNNMIHVGDKVNVISVKSQQ